MVLPPGDKFLYVGQTLNFTVQASDAEESEVLTFTLDLSSPAGAAISPTTGQFSWTPTSPGTNAILVVVTDNGVPPLASSQTFNVVVLDLPHLAPLSLSGNSLTLGWPSAPGKLYRFEYKADLNSPSWTALGPDQLGTGDILTVTVDITNAVQGFYRVEVLP